MGNFGEADQYWWLPFGQIKVMSGHIGAIFSIGAFLCWFVVSRAELGDITVQTLPEAQRTQDIESVT